MGHHSCCNKQKVRRGLWSPEEDEKLINYISTYGHGCWSSVPRLAGLQRCGKSCRLRWINYLRPDLKRGSFSPQEESLIIELHRILGNRWAQIAKHLPGRTDNEVKNFWNSSIKKKLLSHGGAPMLIPAELSNQVSHSGDLLPLSANPNLMATSQDLVFLTSATPMSHGFGNEDLKTDVINNSIDWINAPPPLQPSAYGSTWALDHHHHDQQHHNFHEDYQCLAANGKEAAPLMPYDPSAASTMPQLGEIVDSHEVDIDARLPYFPSGSYPYDLYVAMNNQMDYMDAVITSSSSLLSCGNFPINPNLPPN